MFTTRARRALMGVLLAATVAAAAPASASAFDSWYSCSLKPSGQWCDGRANGTFDGLHSWDLNEGWYSGGGSITVCEHVWKPDTGNELGTGETCGTNSSWHYYGNVQCACYEAEVRQFSGGSHSINGHADAAY